MLASDAPVVIQNRIPRSRPRNPIQSSRAPLRPRLGRHCHRPDLSAQSALCTSAVAATSGSRTERSILVLRSCALASESPHRCRHRSTLDGHARICRAVAHVRRRGARRIPWVGPAAGRLGGAPASARAARRALEAALQCAIRMLACRGLIGCSEQRTERDAQRGRTKRLCRALTLHETKPAATAETGTGRYFAAPLRSAAETLLPSAAPPSLPPSAPIDSAVAGTACESQGATRLSRALERENRA
jgi:hypothetical protein